MFGKNIGYNSVKELVEHTDKYHTSLKKKQYTVNVQHQLKGEQVTKLIKAVQQSEHWRGQSQKWRTKFVEHSQKWQKIFSIFIALLILFTILYFVIPYFYNRHLQQIQRQKSLNQRKIKVQTFVHDKIEKLLVKYQYELKNGLIQIEQQFKFKEFKAEASLKLRLRFKSNKLTFSYEIEGNVQNEIQIYDKREDIQQSGLGWVIFFIITLCLVVCCCFLCASS